ncbi:MAG: hypothetical protein WBW04_11135 [Nitrolancea sp.]
MAAVPVGRRYARVFIADSHEPIDAVVELRPEREDYRWIVTGLGARVPRGSELSEEVSLVWADLLSYASRVAGHSGAKRVHASVPLDSLIQDTLIGAGFSVYARRSVLSAQHLRLAECNGAHVRERDPSDAWSIHHLYHLTTPRPVQYAEALTSNHWDARKTLNARTRGFVIDDKDGLAGYCQLMSRGECHVLDVIMLPDKLEMLGAFVSETIRLANIENASEFWVSVPDYRLDYRPAFEALGFQEYDRQSMMVRYTMVPVNGRHVRWTNVVTDVMERLPARTPVVSRWERDGA